MNSAEVTADDVKHLNWLETKLGDRLLDKVLVYTGRVAYLAVLQIDDLKRGLSDDHAVPGAEPARHDVGEVQTLLDKRNRIRAHLACITQTLLNKGHVVIRQGLHFGVVPARDRLRGWSVMEGAAQLPLRKRMRSGSLLGSL